jgi:hypothetical protein
MWVEVKWKDLKPYPKKGDFALGSATFGGCVWSSEGMMVWVRADQFGEFDRLMKRAGTKYQALP